MILKLKLQILDLKFRQFQTNLKWIYLAFCSLFFFSSARRASRFFFFSSFDSVGLPYLSFNALILGFNNLLTRCFTLYNLNRSKSVRFAFCVWDGRVDAFKWIEREKEELVNQIQIQIKIKLDHLQSEVWILIKSISDGTSYTKYHHFELDHLRIQQALTINIAKSIQTIHLPSVN